MKARFLDKNDMFQLNLMSLVAYLFLVMLDKSKTFCIFFAGVQNSEMETYCQKSSISGFILPNKQLSYFLTWTG